MRILITGASGMLGSALASELSKKHQVFATGRSDFVTHLKYKSFDLSNSNYKPLVEWSNPQLIIHCAAITDAEFCEANSLEAIKINALSVEKLIQCVSEKVKIIYISSDAVFNLINNKSKEKDYTNPNNVYGKTKEIGEFFILNSSRSNVIIVRTTIVGINFYRKGNSLVEWIINSVNSKRKITLFNDVIFNPISIWDLIKELDFLINCETIDFKILHVSGNQNCSKYFFGVELLKALKLNLDYIQKGSIKDNIKIANKRRDQSIDCSLYQKKFNRKLPSIKDAIDSIKKNFRNEKRY
ncbi:MAG: sugar nucleotide-binding protein [Bacteroidota bacterium]|nr:sugar nucleotide-binding protein [Bacteroidota bacterium]